MTEAQRAARLVELMRTRAWCYWVFPGWWDHEHGLRYTISVVVEREAGHYPTGTHGLAPVRTVATFDAPEGFETATLEARFHNRDRGISDRETDRIVSSSLGADVGYGERLI